MPKVRQEFIHIAQSLFGDMTLTWTLDREETALDEYIEKHGVFHLLQQQRKDEAEQRLLDLYFASAFSDAWETTIEPLAAWRLIGLEKAEVGYLDMANDIASCLSKKSTPKNDIEVLQGVAIYCHGMGIYTPAESIFEYALKLSQKWYPETDETIRNCLYQLSDAKLVSGKYQEAQQYIERDIALSIQYAGLEDKSTISSRLLWINILIYQGRYSDCLNPALELLATIEKVCDSEDDLFGEIFHSLGMVMMELDRLDEAENYFQQDLQRSVRIFGEEHSGTIAAVGMMGKLRNRQGLYEEARVHFKKTYDLYLKIYGSTHPKTLVALANIATASGEIGEYRQAFEVQQKVLEIRRRKLGEFHPSTLQAMRNLAFFHKNLEEYEQAESLLLQAISAQKQTLGEEHPEVLGSLSNYLLLLLELDRPEEAIDGLTEVWETSARILGKEHGDTLNVQFNLAGAYSTVGEYEQSMEMMREVCISLRRIWGDEHPRIIGAYEELLSVAVFVYDLDVLVEVSYFLRSAAKKLAEQGEQERACQLSLMSFPWLMEEEDVGIQMGIQEVLTYASLLDRDEQIEIALSLCETLEVHEEEDRAHQLLTELVQKYPQDEDVLYAFGCSALSQEEFETAHDALVQVLSIRSEEDPEELTQVQYKYGQCLYRLERYTKALQAFENVLYAEIEMYGEESSELSMTYWSLAKTFSKLNRVEEAAEYRHQCWILEIEEQGIHDSDTLQTAVALVKDCLAAERFDKAQSIIRKSLEGIEEREDTEEIQEWIEALQELQYSADD